MSATPMRGAVAGVAGDDTVEGAFTTSAKIVVAGEGTVEGSATTADKQPSALGH